MNTEVKIDPNRIQEIVGSILPKVRKKFLNLRGVHQIGFGLKEIDGQLTDALAFRFYVNKKQSLSKISLTKDGGALKGIVEKFEVNAVNGTAGFTILLPITPKRNAFSTSLFLSYNSSRSNGPIGLRWSVDYPMIQRKIVKKFGAITRIYCGGIG